MPACTFFGHRDCPVAIKPRLRAAVVELIERYGVDQFYVGRQGAFDAMVRSVLRELAETYPHISYAVVLERLPDGKQKPDMRDLSPTIFPDGLDPGSPSPSATSGCFASLTMWLPTSPTAGEGQLSMWRRPPGWERSW